MIVTYDSNDDDRELTEEEKKALKAPRPSEANYTADSPELTEERAMMLGDTMSKRRIIREEGRIKFEMTKEYADFIEKYIPSSTFKDKTTKSGHAFSDSEMAAIIWNSRKSLPEKHEDLCRIAEKTYDEILKKQIEERIEYDQDALKLFRNNEGGFVYALNIHEDYFDEDDKLDGTEEYIQGYYGTCETAYRNGCRKGCFFDILKYQIIYEDTEIIRSRNISSPWFEPDEDKQVEESDAEGNSIGRIEYDRKGQIIGCGSDELPKERLIRMNPLDNRRFENAFVVYPNPFKENDRVKIVESEIICERGVSGWVETSPEEWRQLIIKSCSEDAFEDYSDATLVVRYRDEDRQIWKYAHVAPSCLELIDEET